MQKDIRQVIENNHLFEGLPTDLVEKIAASTTSKKVAAGEILFQKGDPADALWGVLSGRIVIEIRTDDGKEMVLGTFTDGDVFGEVGVLDFGPRQVEARAVRKSRLFRLERKHFLRFLHSSPELCFRVFTLLCSHVRNTTENLEDTALYKLPNRLAKRLIMLTTEPTNGSGFVLHISQSDLASRLGVNREAVNRHLRAFEKEGLLRLGRKVVEILDQEALSKIASPGHIHHRTTWETEDLVTVAPQGFTSTPGDVDMPKKRERHAALLAVNAAEYSRSLLSDAAGTLKRIESGLKTVDRAIESHQGNIVSHTGDRVLAEFPNVQMAMQTALVIHEKVNPTDRKRKNGELFRIGVHHGGVTVDDHRYTGEAVNTAIRLTQLSGVGGIAISGAVRDTFASDEQLEWHFLGDHELKNVPGKVPVYSARIIPIFKLLVLRAESLVPRRFRAVTATVVWVLLLAGIWFSGDWAGRQQSSLTAAQMSIAVLPFAGGDDPALGYLAEGITEEVRATLLAIPGMRVIGRESSGLLEEHETNIDEIARSLEVAWLLRGDLRSENNETLATIQFLNTASREPVWEEQFRDSGQGFGGLSKIIVKRIGAEIGIGGEDGPGLPQLRPLTTHSEAYGLFLEAQKLIWLGRQRYIINAVPLLQSAIELDPLFAEAHAELAMLYRFTPMLDQQPAFNPGIREDLARQSLQRALSLKPDSPFVLAKAAETRVIDGDFEGAAALVERALRIDPNNTAAIQALFWIEHQQEDWVGALETSGRWIQLEPLSLNATTSRISVLLMANRHREVLTVANRALAFYPESEVPFMHASVALAKLGLGDRLGAIDSSRRGMPYGGPIDLWTGLEYDWDFFDELDPLRSATGLVYIEEYDQVRQLLIDNWHGDDPDSAGANSLDYLVNRGELETLAGEYGLAVEFFDKARSLTADDELGLAGANVGYAVLDWSRQSHYSVAMLLAYRKTGRDTTADRLATQIEGLLNGRIAAIAVVNDQAESMFLYNMAQYHAIEGRVDEALVNLRTWVDRGERIFTYIKWDPFMESLRGDPAFEAIVAEVEARLAETRLQYHAQRAESP